MTSDSNPALANTLGRAALAKGALVCTSPEGQSAVEQLLAIAADSDLQDGLLFQLQQLLTQDLHLERGLQALVRFINNLRIPKSFFVFLERDRDALPSLMQILSIESAAVEWLVQDPDSFDWLRLSAGQSVDPEHLKDTLINEIQNLDDLPQILSSLNRFRKRETLRVVCAVCLHAMPWQQACQQLSWIADAGISAAILAASAEHQDERRLSSTTVSALKNLKDRLCVIAIGALGGQEMELHGAIELFLIHDSEQLLDNPRSTFILDELNRLTHRALDMIRSSQGLSYNVCLPLNASEAGAPNDEFIHDYRRWIQSMENHGRTWQRMALMKARYVAGDPSLASRLLEELPSLVYSRYLTRADIAGIGALKRKIDRDGKALDSTLTSHSAWTIELLQGWKREVEFLTQFLQLIHGGDLPPVRLANTVQGLDALAQSGCLTEQEKSILVTAYKRFYEAVFASQLSDPLQTQHAIPLCSETHRSTGALRDGLLDSWNRVRQIHNHLLGEVFADENQASEETDLILDPNPKVEWVDHLLAKYGFQRPNTAYKNLMELSREEVSMLSTRRCRHFLSIIATRLLVKISKTPDPDLTLDNLAASCRSLGGKGVLWELFSVHEPSLDLYIRLCGASPYLIGILTSNPGMIDELLDSLMLNRLPTEQELGMMMHELCRGAEDIEPIVHSFKNARHLNVGVRDILGKESITDTHRALADIADVCFQQTVHAQYSRLVKRYGVPTTTSGEACHFAVVALGKLGAREPNYHSDVTLLFVYDEPGTTRPFGPTRHHEPVSTEDFFHQLAQKVAQVANRVGRSGRLYETKNWMITANRNTSLSWCLEELRRYLTDHPELWGQRQELCNARCIVGDAEFQTRVHQAFQRIVAECPWTQTDQNAAISKRRDLELSAGERNLKRGLGGTLDVETIAQLLMLKNAAAHPMVWGHGTLEAIERLRNVGILESSDADKLKEGYNFLRGVESGLRLMNTLARHDLPDSETELARLAYVLNLPSKDWLEASCQRFRETHRELFLKYLGT